MATLGIMKKIDDLRSVWKNEQYDFTPWLAKEENIALLSETIGIDILVEETESDVGNFHADILGVEEGTDRKIVIENQLEESDHTHLGQIITYAAGKSASTIIWIVKNARAEHRAAVEWLNSHSDENINFFLIEIELWQIDNSLFAPKFNIVEQPNNWAKEIKKNANAVSTQARSARLAFWEAFNEYAFADKLYKKEFNARKPSTDHWYDLSIGISKCRICILYLVQRNEISIEFYIYSDKELFDKLHNNKKAIEETIGCSLDWRKLPDKKASKILLTKNFDLKDESLQTQEFDWIMEMTLKFKETFIKYCK